MCTVNMNVQCGHIGVCCEVHPCGVVITQTRVCAPFQQRTHRLNGSPHRDSSKVLQSMWEPVCSYMEKETIISSML